MMSPTTTPTDAAAAAAAAAGGLRRRALAALNFVFFLQWSLVAAAAATVDQHNITTAAVVRTNNSKGRIGFGTAALGSNCYGAVTWALETGFRTFDTAEENEYWYDSQTVGRAARDYFTHLYQQVQQQRQQQEDGADEASSPTTCDSDKNDPKRQEAMDPSCRNKISSMFDLCSREDFRMSTKIPPWRLTSVEDIRRYARDSQKELVGFCDSPLGSSSSTSSSSLFPLDAYYIHAPECWRGWHPRCDDPPPSLLNLRESWLALEAVAGLDGSARRIGLSNVRVDELLDIVQFVRDREREQEKQQHDASSSSVRIAPPRIPDVVQAYSDPIEPSDELRETCKRLGIEFVSYSTLGTQHRYRRNRDKGGELENPVLTSPVITSIAAKHQRSCAEVVLSWALSKNMSVIPRSGNLRHIQELSRLFADPEFLDADDLRNIDAMKHTLYDAMWCTESCK